MLRHEKRKLLKLFQNRHFSYRGSSNVVIDTPNKGLADSHESRFNATEIEPISIRPRAVIKYDIISF